MFNRVSGGTECSEQESGLLQVVERDGWEWTLGGWWLGAFGGAGWVQAFVHRDIHKV